MEKGIIDAAISKFKKTYDKTPEECGYPFIGIYKKQHAYLYGRSEKAIAAYKTSQNIIRWMMTFFMWPVAIDATLCFYWLIRTQADLLHPMVVGTISFFVLWCVVLFGILWHKVYKTEKLHKDNVIYLNY